MNEFDFSRVGKEIKRLRLALGLSQNDLLDGDLRQSTLSKIENGEIANIRMVSFLTICERLGVEPDYFIKIAMIDSYPYIDEVTKRMDWHRRRDEFEELYQIVKAEKENLYFQQQTKPRQYMLWNEAICIFTIDHNFELALKQLKAALRLTHKPKKNYNEREIEILVSIAGIQMDQGYSNEAIANYELCLEHLNKIEKLYNSDIKTKVYSNIVKWKANHQQNHKSIDLCYLGIDWCQQNDSLYLFDNFHYYLGYNYDLLEEYDKAINYYYQSLEMFEKKNKTEHINIVREKIENLKDKLEDNQ